MGRTDISRIKTAIETGHRAPGILAEVMREVAKGQCHNPARFDWDKDIVIIPIVPCRECIVCIAKEVANAEA